MALAFKEWSYIVDALGKGYQSIILRKGGIAEEGGDFTVKGSKFLLLPTLFHQAKNLIKEDWLPKLSDTTFHSSPDKVRLDYFAEIAETRLVKDWSILQKLYNQHAWKEEIIKERFNRWEKSVYLLIVQVYKLKVPAEITILPEYEGCKSWVELQDQIDLNGDPVIYEKIRGTYF